VDTENGRAADEPSASDRIDVGLAFDLRNPEQWYQNPSRLYGFTLEVCEEAEQQGASSLWFSEHHLFDDDYVSNPLTLAAAVGARTRRIRVGTSIVIAPLHHPVEIAEQSAAVDLISEGRFDLGIGAGYRVPEFSLFDVPLDQRYRRTDDTARRLRELWGPKGVRPRPVQDRLPIWMGYLGPKGARRAGLLGERLLSADASLWQHYSAGLIDGGHAVSVGEMAGGFSAWVSEDPERDWPVVSPLLANRLDSYARHAVEGTGRPAPDPVDLHQVINSASLGATSSIAYGTPEFVAEQIRAYTAGAPVRTVILWATIAGLDEKMVLRNVETICTRLTSLLRSSDRDKGHSAEAGAH
jgi:alkanesulfonate monooxygenase SsuD/methylene tetrahydromethanopterin reductase-like flavin-dependent oxidoreductase (luciferase family)